MRKRARRKPGATKIVRCYTGEAKGHAQVRRTRRDGWTAARRRTFLEHLAATSNVDASVEAAGMGKTCAYRLRKRDAGFREAWAEALAEGYEALEIMLLHRARFGTEKPVFHAGKQVAVIREYSDAVALRLLTLHRATVAEQRARERTGGADQDRPPEMLIEEVKTRLAEMRVRRAAMEERDRLAMEGRDRSAVERFAPAEGFP